MQLQPVAQLVAVGKEHLHKQHSCTQSVALHPCCQPQFCDTLSRSFATASQAVRIITAEESLREGASWMGTHCEHAMSKALSRRTHPGRSRAFADVVVRRRPGVRNAAGAARCVWSTCRTAHGRWKDAAGSKDPSRRACCRKAYHDEVRNSATACRTICKAQQTPLSGTLDLSFMSVLQAVQSDLCRLTESCHTCAEPAHTLLAPPIDSLSPPSCPARLPHCQLAGLKL